MGAFYHSSTNGLEERSVQNFKHAFKADKINMIIEQCNTTWIVSYLSTTVVSPAQLLFGQEGEEKASPE